MTPSRLQDAAGRPVRLGAELARGGEGTVHDLPDRPDSVAKLYLSGEKARAMAEKLAAMTAMAVPRTRALAAWPSATLHVPGGALAGFVMPKLAGQKPVFQVYGPKLRLRQFPRADWRFLVHTAGNVARAFAAVHAEGLVVGDVNHGNLFVGSDATVRFIDTDSMQVTHRGRTWLCEVGVSTHQPPEMQGLASYRGVTRTANHDAFGMAVLIFQLLCVGRHPFSGRFTGRGEPPDIERAITESRYAYSAETGRTAMLPPPGSLPMAALPGELRNLFERAFAPEAARAGRPRAESWATALQALGNGLQKCPDNAGHWFTGGLGACPWCALERSSGVLLFPALFAPGAPGAGAAEILLLWQQIDAVPVPGPLPPLRPPSVTRVVPSPRAQEAARRLRQWRLAAAAVLVIGLLLCFSMLGGLSLLAGLSAGAGAAALLWRFGEGPDARATRRALSKARQDWTAMEQRWAPGPASRFAEVKERLEQLKREHDAMPQLRTRELAGLRQGGRARQLRAHLERFEIADAKIAGVGKARVATLLSFGIETAADIDAGRIAALPGFGPRITAALVAFRQEKEAAFVHDPAQEAPPASVAAMDGMLGQRSLKIAAELRAGLSELRAIAADEERHRAALSLTADALRERCAQALADARALGVR